MYFIPATSFADQLPQVVIRIDFQIHIRILIAKQYDDKEHIQVKYDLDDAFEKLFFQKSILRVFLIYLILI